MYKIAYTSDGIQTEYHFDNDWKWFAPDDIKVSVNGTKLESNQYAVVENILETEYETPQQFEANNFGSRAFRGGKVILAAAPANGAEIEICRNISLERPIDYQPTAQIQPEQLNTDFDYVVEAIKDAGGQIQDKSDEVGNIGPRGPAGPAGSIGPQGPKGDKGDPGEPGAGGMNPPVIQQNHTDEYGNVCANYIETDTEILASGIVKSNFTNGWYKKNKLTHWIEQGLLANGTVQDSHIVFPINMPDTNYHLLLSGSWNGVGTYVSASGVIWHNKTAAGFNLGKDGSVLNAAVTVQISGMLS